MQRCVVADTRGSDVELVAVESLSSASQEQGGSARRRGNWDLRRVLPDRVGNIPTAVQGRTRQGRPPPARRSVMPKPLAGPSTPPCSAIGAVQRWSSSTASEAAARRTCLVRRGGACGSGRASRSASVERFVRDGFAAHEWRWCGRLGLAVGSGPKGDRAGMWTAAPRTRGICPEIRCVRRRLRNASLPTGREGHAKGSGD